MKRGKVSITVSVIVIPVLAFLCLPVLNLSRFDSVPLKRSFAKHDELTWEKGLGIGRGVFDSLDSAAVTLLENSDGGLLFPDRFQEEEIEYEIIKADEDGFFEGSWLSGEVVAACLVPPAFDEEGGLTEWRYGQLHELDGSEMSQEKRRLLIEELSSYGVDFDAEGGFQLYNLPESYPVSEALVLAKVSEIDGDELSVGSGFASYQKDTGFESHSSHVRKKGPYLVSHAEFFTWHGASLSCAWNLRREGGIRKLEMDFEVGEVAAFGKLVIKSLHREPGGFDAGVPAVGATEPVIQFSKEGDESVDTCFFAINLPARMFRFVEISEDGAAWTRVRAGLDDGIGWFQIPSETKSFRWRVLYYPPPLRIIADIEKLGGVPQYNRDAATFGELRFPLGKMKLNQHSLFFLLWQLPGSAQQINWDTYDEENPDFVWSDPDHFYSADELFSLWRKFNPDHTIRFDPETVTFVIEDKISLLERLRRRFFK